MERALNRSRGCLLGLAVGDALGTTVEFQRRGSFPPVTDMVGGGSFPIKWLECLFMRAEMTELADQLVRLEPRISG